jgi:tRNA-2-methylthio-N6-dimethylallyladenosine synthase
MNVHDSERLSGLLEGAGYVPAEPGATADVVVFNTCAVRENADNRLYGNLGHLAPVKKNRPGMQIAVGGCMAQKDRGTILDRAPWVDVVFGTHNIGSLPALLERARHNDEAQVEILEALEVFPSTLPTKRDSTYAAWVSISVGCNNTCTFCIVPSLRGKEKNRRAGDILAEVRALVEQGVLEVTLLGQNVNSYGSDLGDRGAFAKLLRACGDIDGLERVRFTSPHPKDFTEDVVDAMAQTPNVMHQLHMPLQSGSDAVLRRMQRSYRQERYLRIIDRVRAAMPDAAITTDIIVGFPARRTTTSSRRSTWCARHGSRARSPSSTRSAPVRRPPRCPTRSRRRSSRSATSAWWRCRTRSPGRRTRRRSAEPWRCSSPRARAARTARRTGCPVARGTTGWCTSRRLPVCDRGIWST